jgi:N,N'-diacetyllegionaminate synthase
MKLIAETAWHHEGDMEFMRELTRKIGESSAHILKVHLSLSLKEYMTPQHEAFSILNNLKLSEEQWFEILSDFRKNSNKDLMLLYNDCKAVDFGSKFEPEYVEIHGACLNDVNLLKHLKTKLLRETKVVLGIGGSSLIEVENAMSFFPDNQIILMYGFQNFPTNYEDINLSKLRKIMKLYPNAEFGYADHTAYDNENNVLITLLGAAVGMKYVEKHVTHSYGTKRTDYSAAISFEMFEDISNGLELLEKANGNGKLDLNKGELEYAKYKKAPVASKNLKKGHIMQLEDISFKRVREMKDLSMIQANSLVGKSLLVDLNLDDTLENSMFSSI